MDVKDIISSGLLELYVTGATSHEEKLQVEQWAKEFPEVKQEINELEEAIENYAMANAIEPSASIKEKIFSRIQTSVQLESSLKNIPEKNEGAVVYKMPSYFKWAAAACIILLLGSIYFNYTFYNKYQNATENLQATQNEMQRQQSELQKQQQLAEAMHKDMDVMTDKNALSVVLNGTAHSPDALAKIFWMKNTGEVYVDPTNLPETPAGKQYQLWAIIDGKPVDAGMITTQKGTYHIQKMKSFGKAQAFAITLEKSGGSPSPTMDQMIVMAKI